MTLYFPLLAPKESNKGKGTLQLGPDMVRTTLAARFQSAGQQTRPDGVGTQTCRLFDPPEISALGYAAMGREKTVIVQPQRPYQAYIC